MVYLCEGFLPWCFIVFFSFWGLSLGGSFFFFFMWFVSSDFAAYVQSYWLVFTTGIAVETKIARFRCSSQFEEQTKGNLAMKPTWRNIFGFVRNPSNLRWTYPPQARAAIASAREDQAQ